MFHSRTLHDTDDSTTKTTCEMQAIAASNVVAPARQFNGAKKSFSVKKVRQYFFPPGKRYTIQESQYRRCLSIAVV